MTCEEQKWHDGQVYNDSCSNSTAGNASDLICIEVEMVTVKGASRRYH